MRRYIHYLYYLVILCVMINVTSQEERVDEGHREEEDADEDYDLFDEDAMHDQEHMKEHLEGQVNTEKELTNEDMEFLYFKEHDFDANNRLDGLEMMQIMQHSHHKKPPNGNATDGHDRAHEPPAHHEEVDPRKTQEQLAKIFKSIDKILEQHDKDNDGYMDFSEFYTAREHILAERKKHKKLK